AGGRSQESARFDSGRDGGEDLRVRNAGAMRPASQGLRARRNHGQRAPVLVLRKRPRGASRQGAESDRESGGSLARRLTTNALCCRGTPALAAAPLSLPRRRFRFDQKNVRRARKYITPPATA